MKKILLVVAVVLSAFAASAQKSATVATASLTNGKSAGVYLFTLPSDISADQVNDASQYYTEYFTVAFDAVKHDAVITLTKNEEMNRRVINRFMVSMQVQSFNVDGKTYTYDELFNAYMK